jgi:hypothetical protein
MGITSTSKKIVKSSGRKVGAKNTQTHEENLALSCGSHSPILSPIIRSGIFCQLGRKGSLEKGEVDSVDEGNGRSQPKVSGELNSVSISPGEVKLPNVRDYIAGVRFVRQSQDASDNFCLLIALAHATKPEHWDKLLFNRDGKNNFDIFFNVTRYFDTLDKDIVGDWRKYGITGGMIFYLLKHLVRQKIISSYTWTRIKANRRKRLFEILFNKKNDLKQYRGTTLVLFGYSIPSDKRKTYCNRVLGKNNKTKKRIEDHDSVEAFLELGEDKEVMKFSRHATALTVLPDNRLLLLDGGCTKPKILENLKDTFWEALVQSCAGVYSAYAFNFQSDDVLCTHHVVK